MDKRRQSLSECLRAADDALRNLSLYTGVLDDPIGRAYAALIDVLTPGTADPALDAARNHEREPAGSHLAAGSRPSRLYRRLYSLLADEAEFLAAPPLGDAWQNHLLDRILADENAFSRKAQRVPYGQIGPAVRSAAAEDLRQLERLCRFAGPRLVAAVQDREPDVDGLPDLQGFAPLAGASPSPSAERDDAMKRRFAAARSWDTLIEPLADHIHERGLGIFRGFIAFRWERHGASGRLVGIEEPDPLHLDDLIGYEAQRRLLIQNTEHFVAGFPANNILLYGDRGTGKSSTVKGLLHAYEGRGLRMVEVQKEHLNDFPQILRLLRGRREWFILFIDDLSFEENETHYKDLKALLEGSLEARPDNVLLYATSNRRHLVKERFSDRIHGLEDDEIHLNDTSEEKLSLSDRFGLTLTFTAPTQEGYLEIVRGLARREGVTMPEEELHGLALAWAAQRGGRSGRVARQFMNHIVAEIGMRAAAV